MKSIKNYIIEALKINSKSKVIKYFPKTKEELIDIINKRIESEGNECNLNDIDTSKIKDMSGLFDAFTDFNGDISRWDVSNVTKMYYMFAHSEFNGDISKWNVRNVKNMAGMFYDSQFNGDISKWNVRNVKNMAGMFYSSIFNQDISDWDVSNVECMDLMFSDAEFNQDISKWKISDDCEVFSMLRNNYREDFVPFGLLDKIKN